MYKLGGVVFISDSRLYFPSDLKGLNSAQISTAAAALIKKNYAYPNQAMGILSHTLEANCSILAPDKLQYSILIGFWMVFLIGWIYLTFYKYDLESSQLQKILTVMPVLKFIDVFTFGLFLG